jgi:hypothetical protein
VEDKLMSFANTSVTDIIATTIENRSKKIADNVANNNALLARLKQRGKSRPISGGRIIFEEISFASNGNAGFYSGYDLLPVAAQDVISAAQFNIKQAACPVVISGLELLQNAGSEQMIDLLTSRIDVAESTMQNIIASSIYGDGTGSGGKAIDGLLAVLPSVAPASNTTIYGNIAVGASSNQFWANQYGTSAYAAGTMISDMNSMWASLVRGMDRPDLIVMDNTSWTRYVGLLQAQQRFASADTVAGAGFPSVKFMDADVVMDGGMTYAASNGIAAQTRAVANTAYFLNTKYLFFRPHSQRNFVSLSPNKRYSINQDAEVQILAWAGNMTCSNRSLQGKYVWS